MIRIYFLYFAALGFLTGALGAFGFFAFIADFTTFIITPYCPPLYWGGSFSLSLFNQRAMCRIAVVAIAGIAITAALAFST